MNFIRVDSVSVTHRILEQSDNSYLSTHGLGSRGCAPDHHLQTRLLFWATTKKYHLSVVTNGGRMLSITSGCSCMFAVVR